MTADTPITRDPRVIVTGTRDSWMVARPVGGTLVLEIHQPAGEGLPDFCASIVLPSDQADALLTDLDGVWFDHYPEESDTAPYGFLTPEDTREPFTGHPHDTLPTEAGDNPESERTPAISDPWATPAA